MKISGVQVRVERVNSLDPDALCEVYVTKDKPYINHCFHLPSSLVGELSTGTCSLELTQVPTPIAVDKAK